MARGDLRFLTVDELELLSVRVRSPNHWTAREVPSPALSLFFFLPRSRKSYSSSLFGNASFLDLSGSLYLPILKLNSYLF